ncbi:hypothetical protein QQ045_032668 [Rhodiola kirilowii]
MKEDELTGLRIRCEAGEENMMGTGIAEMEMSATDRDCVRTRCLSKEFHDDGISGVGFNGSAESDLHSPEVVNNHRKVHPSTRTTLGCYLMVIHSGQVHPK